MRTLGNGAPGEAARTQRRLRACLAGAAIGLLALHGPAASQSEREALERELQSERREQQRELSRAPGLFRGAPAAPAERPVLGEVPCLEPASWILDAGSPAEARRFDWLLDELGEFGSACLGTRSLEALRRMLDARLVERGFVTSRVTLQPPAAALDPLRVRLHPGRVEALVWRDAGTGAEQPLPAGVVPQRAGDVLDLRALEQGLENLALAAGLQTQIAIEPGQADQTSRVALVFRRDEPWRLDFDLDNLAPRDYGSTRWRAGGSLDGAPLGVLSAAATLQRAARGGEAFQHAGSASLSWAYGWHRLGLVVGASRQQRALQGATRVFRERTADEHLHLSWSWVPWRTASWRSSIGAAASARKASTRVEDIELVLQRRRVREAEVSLELQHRAGGNSIVLQATQRRVLDNDPRIELLPPPEARPRQHELSIVGSLPLRPGLEYHARLHYQAVRQAQTAADLHALGGPGTVRGYDLRSQAVGQQLLWTRHEFHGSAAWLHGPGYAFGWQLGADWGRVRSPDEPLATPDIAHRASLSAGVRGQWAHPGGTSARLHVLVSWPLTRLPDLARRPHWQAALGLGF